MCLPAGSGPWRRLQWRRPHGDRSLQPVPSGLPSLPGRAHPAHAPRARNTQNEADPAPLPLGASTSRRLRTSVSLRSGPVGRLRLVRGARPSAKASRTARHPVRARRAVVTGRLDGASTRADVRGLSSHRSRVDGAGVHGRPDDGAASGTVSSSAPSIATAAGPSAMTWCTFRYKPTRPPGSPGRNHVSHSGRDRSRWRRRNSARVNARQLPAAVGEQVNRVPAGAGAPRLAVLGGMCGLAGK